MPRTYRGILLVLAALTAGCASFDEIFSDATERRTPSEIAASSTYIPLDPLPVSSLPGDSCGNSPAPTYKDILASLPDNAVRIAVGQFDASGKLSFGPSQVGYSGSVYQVILDYINVDATRVQLEIWREVVGIDRTFSIYDYPKDQVSHIFARRVSDTAARSPDAAEPVSVPVYVGVGLRLTATINVLKGNVNLSSLGSIAASAQAGRVTGSLVVQTLGITGKQVRTALPMPSELNNTTVQNAILALGSIKAVMYSTDGIDIAPRVIGIYNPIGNSSAELVNAIVSELARAPIVWRRPCIVSSELSPEMLSTPSRPTVAAPGSRAR